jgi:hypothetical protein
MQSQAANTLPEAGPSSTDEIDDVRAAQIQELSRLVSAQVEAKLAELERAMWQRGQAAFAQARRESQEQVEQLDLGVQVCIDRQETLAREHDLLKKGLVDVSCKINSMRTEVQGLSMPTAAAAAECATSSQSSAPAVGTPSKQPPTQFLSLAEALDNGPTTPPPKVSLTLSEVLKAETAGPAPSTPAPATQRTSSTKQFDFVKVVIKKDGSKDLGLDVCSDGTTLLVENVDPEGLVAAWNAQQQVAPKKGEGEIKDGDRIIEVNGIRGDSIAMLEACRTHDTLRMTLSRVGEADPGSSTKTARRVLVDELIKSLRP